MRFLPVFFDLSAGRVALVGGGPAALNKLRLLLAAHAQVRWFAAKAERSAVSAQIASSPGQVQLDSSDPLATNFAGYSLIISAAGRPVDDEIASRARTLNIPINVVDRPELSTFIMPAVVDRGEVVVAIGTGGNAPVVARRIREQIEALLPSRIGELASLLGRWRPRVTAKLKSFSAKRLFWEQAVDGAVGSAALAGHAGEAEELLLNALSRANDEGTHGSVSIVGAGPGDPDLLTLKALRAISNADIIFYDDLVTDGVLDRIRRDAERVFVGKRRGRPGIGQDEINRLVLAAAEEGKRVVRLKGGDPFIFGRGGEELEYLRAANIPVTVVPGISAALGCAAEAEIPLTLRDVATKLVLLTAHRVEQGAVDWSALAASDTTAVIYMGLSMATSIRDGLLGAGRDPATPVAVLARGTWADSKSVAGRLDALPALTAQISKGPALIVVGEVVRHSALWREALTTSKEVA